MKTPHHSQPNEQTHPNLYRLPFLTNISETPDDDPDQPPPTPGGGGVLGSRLFLETGTSRAPPTRDPERQRALSKPTTSRPSALHLQPFGLFQRVCLAWD